MVRSIGLLLFGLCMALVLPSAVQAQMELGDVNQLLSIKGQVTADQKSANQIGYQAVSIAFTGDSPDKLVWLGIVQAQSWNGDVFVGRQMLQTMQGYTPTFIASGKASLLAKIRQAPVGNRMTVEGIVDMGARTYLVGMVEVTPPPAK